MSSGEVSRKVALVNLQKDITRFFYAVMKQEIPESLSSISIFGKPEEQEGACWCMFDVRAPGAQCALTRVYTSCAVVAEQLLVLGNFELAFRTIQVLRLNASQVYKAAAQRLCVRLRQNADTVFEMLQQFKVMPVGEMNDARSCAYESACHFAILL